MSALEKSLFSLFEKEERDSEQRRSWEAFIEQGLPNPKEDAFRYFPLESLYEETLSDFETLNYDFSFPKPVVALPLSQAKKQYGSLFFSQRRESSFLKLSKALSGEGLFLYIPPRVELDAPLDLSKTFLKNAFPHLTIFLGEGARVKLHRNTIVSGWTFSSTEIALEKGAELLIEEHLHLEKQARFFGTMQARIHENARLQNHSFRTGEGIAREEVNVELRGERADAMLKGAAQLADDAQHHVNVLAHHIAPKTTSHQHFKNILSGRSRASFEGKIYVEKEALLTDAYQLTNHLLLDPKASAFSKPNLEIFADDVKASHGATVSEVDKRYLHYLQTRGIEKKLGKQMLLKGFLLTLFEDTALQKVVAESL
ncbi:MAG: SufD family Fe-S cluster assembly protein [Candidatus Algichlamydia australiensis]|nr:SufD family Fe-S cluster assembly protein [Chlamydiales bacterium]